MATLGDLRRTELLTPRWSWSTAERLRFLAELLWDVLGPIGVAGCVGALLVIAVEAVRWLLA
jgi:hypothetical protein